MTSHRSWLVAALLALSAGCAGIDVERDSGRGGGDLDDGAAPEPPGPRLMDGGLAAPAIPAEPAVDSAEFGGGEGLPCGGEASLEAACEGGGACAGRRVCTAGTERSCTGAEEGLLPGGLRCLPFVGGACGGVAEPVEPGSLQAFGSPAPRLDGGGLRLGGGGRSYGGLRLAGEASAEAGSAALTLSTRVVLPAGCGEGCFGGVVIGWVPADWRPAPGGGPVAEVPWALAVAVSADGSEVALVAGGDAVARVDGAPRSDVLELALRSDPFGGVTVAVAGEPLEDLTLGPAWLPSGPLVAAVAGRSVQGGPVPLLEEVVAHQQVCDVLVVEGASRPVTLRAPGGGRWRPERGAVLGAPVLAHAAGETLLAFEERRADGSVRLRAALRSPDGAFTLLRGGGDGLFELPGRNPQWLVGPDTLRLLALVGDALLAQPLSLDAGNASLQPDGDRTPLLAPQALGSLPTLFVDGPPRDVAVPPGGADAGSVLPDGGGAEAPARQETLESFSAEAIQFPEGEVVVLAVRSTGEDGPRWRLLARGPSLGDWRALRPQELSGWLRELGGAEAVEALSLRAVAGAWSLLATVREGARWRLHQALSDELVHWRPVGLVLSPGGSAAERIGVARATELALEGERLLLYEGLDGVGSSLRQASRPLAR